MPCFIPCGKLGTVSDTNETVVLGAEEKGEKREGNDVLALRRLDGAVMGLPS